MVRAWLAGIGFAAWVLGSPLAAADSDDGTAPMVEVAATGDVCAAARSHLEAAAQPCKVIATSPLDAHRRATLIEIRDPGPAPTADAQDPRRMCAT